MTPSTVPLSRRDLLKAGGALVVSFAFGAVPPTRRSARPPRSRRGRQAARSRPKWTASSPSTPTAPSRSTPARWTSAPGCASPSRRWPPRSSASRSSASRSSTATRRCCPNQGGTGGSTGLTRGGADVRQAAATARQALLALGAARLNRPATDLTIVRRPGAADRRRRGRRHRRARRRPRLSLKVDPEGAARGPGHATRSSASRFRGPTCRPSAPAGTSTSRISRVPGMLHAPRDPSAGDRRDARLGGRSVDPRHSRCARRAGRELSRGRRERRMGGRARRARRSRRPGASGADCPARRSRARICATAPSSAIRRSSIAATRGGDAPARPKTLSATYFWPFQSHASLGPSCAVADVRADGDDHLDRRRRARTACARTCRRSSAFRPRKCASSSSKARAPTAPTAATTRRPMRCCSRRPSGSRCACSGSRQDEHGWDPKGPQQLLDLRAGLDAAGRIVAWETRDVAARPTAGRPAAARREAAGMPQDTAATPAAMHAERRSAVRGRQRARRRALAEGDAAACRRTCARPARSPTCSRWKASPTRSPPRPASIPLAFRSQPAHRSARHRGARRAPPTMFGWQPRPSPNPQARQGGLLVGRGFAYMRYKQAENYVAMAMEVAVDPASGAIGVRRVVCAHDCGLIVNPDALRNQIEGCIVQTLSRALHEEVTFDRVARDQRRLGELSDSDVSRSARRSRSILIDRPDQPLLGAGEAATAPVAAALGERGLRRHRRQAAQRAVHRRAE